MLELNALTVKYGPVSAIEGLSLSVASGEGVALLGANGAGKTSTLRAISGLAPYSGQIRFADEDLAHNAPEAIARMGLIHVPEGRRVFPQLTVHENLQVALAGGTARKARFEIPDVYELFPKLQPLRNRPGWALSGGEQQMVAIGRGLVASPRLLLLDEPSLGLAPSLADAIFDTLAVIAGEMSLLIVEQKATLALSVCSRAYILARGRSVFDGRSQDLLDHPDLLGAYFGSEDSVRLLAHDTPV
jgi:branched-chain amino acid transport system ATP-binding protein